MQLFATYTFGQALLTVLEFALLFVWIWVAITVVADVFRSKDLSGWAKAGWIFLIVVVPLLGVLVYLVARGDKMRQHELVDQRDQDAALRKYIRSAAATPADEITELERLRDRGILDEEQFQRAKEKTLA
ncbi:MAG TPA: SHOCT domain-containing protein [Thermoleophilaceae bacterium]